MKSSNGRKPSVKTCFVHGLSRIPVALRGRSRIWKRAFPVARTPRCSRNTSSVSFCTFPGQTGWNCAIVLYTSGDRSASLRIPSSLYSCWHFRPNRRPVVEAILTGLLPRTPHHSAVHQPPVQDSDIPYYRYNLADDTVHHSSGNSSDYFRLCPCTYIAPPIQRTYT